MSINEVIDETNRVIRYKFNDDGIIKISQSHTYSTMYMLAYKRFYEDIRLANPDLSALRIHNYANMKTRSFVEKERVANGKI